ncbi:MAG: hypothetical protein IPL69_19910 [Saprospiraceae bacterium]|nr:hypothetical protein [Candidatus Brachybacter algidus]
MSDVNNVFEEVEFKVMLQTDMQKAESLDLPSKKYFISMSNYIDLNVIGKGKSLVLSSDKITTFILSQFGTVNSAEQLGEKLLNAYINEEFSETEKRSTERETQGVILDILLQNMNTTRSPMVFFILCWKSIKPGFLWQPRSILRTRKIEFHF